MSIKYESGFSTILGLSLNSTDTVITLGVAPTVTKGRMYIFDGIQKEWVDFTGVSGVTITGCTRNVSSTADPMTGGTGYNFNAGTPVVLVAMHDQLPDKTTANTWVGDQTITGNASISGLLSFTGTDTAGLKIKTLTTAQRDALTPANGDKIYNSTTGTEQTYYGGQWNDAGTSTVANATDAITGKVRLADQTQVNNGTDTESGDPLVVIPSTLKSNLVLNTSQDADLLKNLTIVPSRSSNAETISLKTKAGTAPSATDPIVINFRNATEGTGDYTTITLTAATSITIPSTATMGMTNGVIYRLWLVGINDGGTFKLGVINTQKTTGIHPLKDDVLVSSILIDTASDNAGVIYTAAAATTKAMRVLGYLEYTLAAVGTRDTAPSKIQVYTPSIKLPGDIVQFLYTIPAPTSGTTIMPADGTIPQSGEGVELMTLAITPTSTVNRLLVDAKVNIYANNNGDMGAALFQDAVAGALAAGGAYSTGSTHNTDVSLFYVTLAGTTSSTTFKIRAGLGVAGTIANSGNYSSVQNNYLKITELMA